MPDSGSNEVDHRHWQHELPGKVHQLVHAQSGQRAADPYKHDDHDKELREIPEIRRDPCQERERCGPPAQEQGNSQSADGKHSEILTQEKQRSELEPGVFGVITRDDLRLPFG